MILSGSETEPSKLSLVRVSDLTSFSNPFAAPMHDLCAAIGDADEEKEEE